MLSEVHCTPSLQTQRPPTLPINMDNKQLNELFASCMPRLQRTARQLLRSPQDSEDAVQEGLLLAFRNLGQFQGRSRFSTWLHSIVRNAARTHVRRMQCRLQCSSVEDLANGGDLTLEELSVDTGLSPEEECARRERSRILLEVLKDMPARYKSVVQLCDVDEIDQKQAAQKLGITVCALKTYLFRARRVAARRIRARIILPPDDSSPSRERPSLQRTPISGLSQTASSVLDFRSKVEEEYPMHAKARKNRDPARGTHEHGRKRACTWKYSLAASARISVHSTHRSAC